MNTKSATKMFGPSLANGMRPYRDHYGSETILVEVQDFMISAFAIEPWFAYYVPDDVLAKTYDYWVELRNTIN